eukprot:TRINITY_DN5450_c0_g1_i1.p2 TRINITY_DN5450_c0_g1~~TRINITY_DN5450_c0_g1_i1.p2  ORF type:complete len:293 (-),score=93.56 TRINITY_DN5450_c0_g1_i1:51-929(-)
MDGLGAVGDVVERLEAVHTLSADALIGDAIALLDKHNLSSAPVKAPSGEEWFAFVDMLDFVSLAVGQGDAGGSPAERLQAVCSRPLRTLGESDAMDFSRRNPCTLISLDAPLADAVAPFARGTHRLMVVDSSCAPCSVLSQSRAMQHILSVAGPDGPLGACLDSAVPSGGPVVSVRLGAVTAAEALVRLWREDLSALAVCDGDGALVGAVSASALKRIVPGSEHSLSAKVGHDDDLSLRTDVATVTAGSTLREAAQAMADKSTHRCFVVDGERRPVGVVSYTDVFAAIHDKC